MTTTKRRPKSVEKRQQILVSAMELFTEQGFDNTRMDQVAERAGVSKQTVYSHYHSKDDLFAAAIGQKCISHNLDSSMIDLEQPCAEMLLELARRFHELLLSEGPIRVYRLCVGGAEQHPHLSRLFFAAGPERVINLLTDYLRRQSERGQLNIDNPHHAAVQFLFMIKAEQHMRATLNVAPNPQLADSADYLHSCVAMFMRAYGANAAG